MEETVIVLIGNDVTAYGALYRLDRLKDMFDFRVVHLPLMNFAIDDVFDLPVFNSFVNVAHSEKIRFTSIGQKLYSAQMDRLRPRDELCNEVRIDLTARTVNSIRFHKILSTIPLPLLLEKIDTTYSFERDSLNSSPFESSVCGFIPSFRWWNRHRTETIESTPSLKCHEKIDDRVERVMLPHGNQTRVIQDEKSFEFSSDLDEFFYPIADEKISDLLHRLETLDILSRGKHGAWKQQSPDKLFMQGIEAVDCIFVGANEPTLFKDTFIVRLRQTSSETVYVVAFKNEVLDWVNIHGLHDQCLIYDRGDSGTKIPSRKWYDVPDLGGHNASYLRFIIDHYDTLPPVTVFVPGRPPPNVSPGFFDGVLHSRFIDAHPYTNWGPLEHTSERQLALKNRIIRPYPFTMKDFFTEVFGEEVSHPSSLTYSSSPCFAVSATVIRQHSLGFYENLLSLVIDHWCPEEGFYLDILWYTIFT